MTPDWEPVDEALLSCHKPAPAMQLAGVPCRTCHLNPLLTIPRHSKPGVVVCPGCDLVQRWPLGWPL